MLTNGLAEQYKEHITGFGINQDGASVIQMFMAKDGETWTIVATLPNGMSTILISGHGWTDVIKDQTAVHH